MHPEWANSFQAFIDYIGLMPSDGQRYTIDRIDNKLGYIPGNVRWATNKTQANNTSRNHYYEIDGARLSIAQIADEYGINPNTLSHRLFVKHLSIEEAVKPIRLTLKSKYTHAGKELILEKWIKELGLHFPTVASRLLAGWKFKEAIQPIEKREVTFSTSGNKEDEETHALEWWCELLGLNKGPTYLLVLRGTSFENIVKAA